METPDKKKRPPPIKIPPAPLPLLTPGPNAFALAQKAKREEAERQAKQAASSKPVDAAQPVRACSQRRSDVSAMTSFAQFMQADRNSSPQKVNWPSSVDSRHGSVTTRSQHSHKSHRSMGSTQPLIGHEEEKIYGTDREGEMTRRAAIEDRADQKYLKLVGKHPVSDPRHIAPGGHFKSTTLVSDAEKQKSTKKKTELLKTPMKKIFGMSIPTFGRSSASLASTGAGKTDSVPATPKRTQPSELPIAPTLSIKASRVLGARPSTSLAVPKKPGRPTPRSGRSPPRGSPPRRSPPRSQSSKSLPTTGLQEQNKFTARRPQYNVSMPRRRRSPSRKNGVGRDTYYEYDINQRYSSSPMSTGPPTPPRKDTPKEKKVKEQVAEKQVQAHPEKENKNIQMPNFLTVAKPGPVSSEGGKSPAKYCPLTAADYAKLIEQPPLPSARATISNAAIELEGDTLTSQFKADDEEQKQKYPGWWREERQKRYLTINDDTLPPTFYSPSVWSARLFDGRPSHNADPARLLFTVPPSTRVASSTHPSDGERGSIDMVFQGNVSEIDPFSNMGKAIEGAVSQQATAGAQQNPSTTQADEDSFASRVRRELQREHPGGREPEQNSGGSETPRPHLDESSSRLTEILGRVSPSKTGFNYEYQADCPSAVPSPLHNMPGSHMPPNSMPPPALRVPVNGATSTFPETLSDGSNILTHFYMCNTHMDVLGRTLYDIITEGRAETRSLTHGLAEKQSQLVAAFERQLEEVKNEVKPFKTQMRDLSRTCESVLEQGQQHSQMNERLHNQINQMIASKVEKILDVVKEEVVDRLEKQAKKNAELEDTVKSLQKTVQELQKAVEAKDTAPASKTQVANPFSSPLPQHRPQASLGAGDSIRREMQAIPEGPGRNDPRLQYNYGGASNGAYIHGNTPFSNGNQQWYRPSTAGNVRDGKNDNNAYPGSPYMGMGMGNGTSFGGYFSGGQNDHGYGGYSGTPK